MSIETERLSLRDWREADVQPFIRHTNTEPVMRWLGGVKPPGDMEALVRDRYMRWQSERGFTFWPIERRSDGELLGFCGLKLADGEGCAFAGELEIGWRLREEAWGRGYAREAATAVLDHAFDGLRAERVLAVTYVGNGPSWGLMLRLGMRRRPDLDYLDLRFDEHEPAIVYEIARSEWR